MELADLFSSHIKLVLDNHKKILEETGFGSFVIDAGTAFTYFNDDQHAPFHPNPYFAYLCPVNSAQHLIVINAEEAKPKLIYYLPDDFWHEQKPFEPSFWGAHFDVEQVKSTEELFKACAAEAQVAYLGENSNLALRFGWQVMPQTVVSRIDWDRSFKTEYEIACTSEATRLASLGHKEVERLVAEGASELELHHAYTRATQCTDDHLPYPTIIGWDEKSAILHYHGKREKPGERVLLIDAGASCHGYASDITRTYMKKGCQHAVFERLLIGMNEMQKKVCEAVKPGSSFFELTDLSHKGVADLLLETKIVKSGSVDELIDNEVTKAFYPHGLGHLLGLQVHDVGGMQVDKLGAPCAPPKRYPRMRTNRELRQGMLITVEPGLYFIPMLISGLRDKKVDCDYALLDELIPFGGIRIEDDVLVTASGHRNLTREYLP